VRLPLCPTLLCLCIRKGAAWNPNLGIGDLAFACILIFVTLVFRPKTQNRWHSFMRLTHFSDSARVFFEGSYLVELL
jgi:hypothetical protein